MKMNNNPNANFSFLEPQLAKEAYIYDILGEIQRKQNAFLHSAAETLATLTELQESRAIRIPYTNTRNKNIHYLTDMLCKKHPGIIKAVPSFSFNVDKNSKKLSLNEAVEFSINLNEATFNSLKAQRNAQSKKNILDLFSMFRLTNLTKLLANSSNKAYLMDILRENENKDFFIFKQYAFDKNMNEISEIFCFHKKNFEHVKQGLKLDDFRQILAAHSAAVIRKMKTFGIMNTNFSDYSDNKIDYLISTILEELSPNFNKKDILAVKNFASLRSCLLNVNKFIDPLVSSSAEITAYIKKNGVCKGDELAAVFPNVTLAMLASWPVEELEKRKIITGRRDNGTLYFIDATSLLGKVESLHASIVLKPEHFSNMSYDEQNNALNLMDVLYQAGTELLGKGDKSISLLGNETAAQKLKQLLKEYDNFNSHSETPPKHKESDKLDESHSVFAKIIGFFASIFGSSKNAKSETKNKSGISGSKIPFSSITRDIYSQIKNRRSPLIPLSDYLELSRENSKDIDTIINELRANSLKIVIPIYNARTALYPTRSQSYIISDMEYLMVAPEIIASADTIREFTDSLVGYQLKDEVIPGRGIMAIENYLLTLYRQHKAKMRRKRK